MEGRRGTGAGAETLAGETGGGIGAGAGPATSNAAVHLTVQCLVTEMTQGAGGETGRSRAGAGAGLRRQRRRSSWCLFKYCR